jgi:hypothetical protein
VQHGRREALDGRGQGNRAVVPRPESICTQSVSVGVDMEMVELFRNSLRFAETIYEERVPVPELIPGRAAQSGSINFCVWL